MAGLIARLAAEAHPVESPPAALPRHRHDLSRDEVRASQQVRLLAATAQAMADKGYAATSVADIVSLAGVSRKTFYELYADKEAAFLAAYAAIDLVIAHLATNARGHGEAREMLHAGARAYLELLSVEPALTHMLVIDAVGAGPIVLARRKAAFDQFVAMLAVAIELARLTDPSIPEPDPRLLLAVLGGINELVLERLVDGDPHTLVDLLPTVTKLLDAVCLGPDAAG